MSQQDFSGSPVQALAKAATVARNERESGLSSVAAPVFGPGGRLAGTVAISLPTLGYVASSGTTAGAQ